MTKGKALFVEGEIPKIQRICYFLSETSATSHYEKLSIH